MPRSQSPASPSSQAITGFGFRLPLQVGRRRLHCVFRSSHARPTHSLSTLRSRGYPRSTQDSLPAGGHPCRAGFPPAGSVKEVSVPTFSFRSSLPPPPGFAWRTPGNDRRLWPPQAAPPRPCSAESEGTPAAPAPHPSAAQRPNLALLTHSGQPSGWPLEIVWIGAYSPSSPIASTGQEAFASLHCASSSPPSGCLWTKE